VTIAVLPPVVIGVVITTAARSGPTPGICWIAV
jgi:hypothetical protein